MVFAASTAESFVVLPQQMEAVRVIHASASSPPMEAVATILCIRGTTLRQVMEVDVKRISVMHLLPRRVLVLDVVLSVVDDQQIRRQGP